MYLIRTHAALGVAPRSRYFIPASWHHDALNRHSSVELAREGLDMTPARTVRVSLVVSVRDGQSAQHLRRY